MRVDLLTRPYWAGFAVAAAFGPASLGRAEEPPAHKTPAPAVNPNAVVAVVNGESLTLGQVDAVIRQRPPVAPLIREQVHQLRAAVASEMIDEILLRQFLSKYAPAVESAEVDRHYKALAELLAKQGKTPADFFRETGQSEAQARETWTALLQLALYVKDRVTDEQLQQYFAANRDHFDRAEVRVSHIVVRLGARASAEEREAARKKLLALRAEIAGGKLTFADAARKHSQCPSAMQGGDLGYIVRKSMLQDEAFCKAAFSLKAAELGDVIESEIGLHLLVVTDRELGVHAVFEKCVEDVRESFTDDFRQELIAKLRKQAQVRMTVP